MWDSGHYKTQTKGGDIKLSGLDKYMSSENKGKVSFVFSAFDWICYIYSTCKEQSSEDMKQEIRFANMDGVHVLSKPVQN